MRAAVCAAGSRRAIRCPLKQVLSRPCAVFSFAGRACAPLACKWRQGGSRQQHPRPFLTAAPLLLGAFGCSAPCWLHCLDPCTVQTWVERVPTVCSRCRAMPRHKLHNAAHAVMWLSSLVPYIAPPQLASRAHIVGLLSAVAPRGTVIELGGRVLSERQEDASWWCSVSLLSPLMITCMVRHFI